MKTKDEMTLETLKSAHDERVKEAHKEHQCSEWVGPHPEGYVEHGIHHGPILQRCANKPVSGSERCADCEANMNNGMKHCYGCGALHPFVTDYKWEVWPSNSYHKHDVLIWAVQPCCGRQANTECVAVFYGEYHGGLEAARERAEQVCIAHNEQLAPAYEEWKQMRDRVQARMKENRKITDEEARELWPKLFKLADRRKAGKL